MRLTDEQKSAIVDDIVNQMQEVIDEPLDHIYDELEFEEDDWGRCYRNGSHNFSQVLEEICPDGIPGIDSENSDVYISVEYDGYLTFHDDYDSGDYWNPPSGGIEIDSIELILQSLEMEISVLNPETDEYEEIEVTEREISTLKQTIASKIKNRPERRMSSQKKVAV